MKLFEERIDLIIWRYFLLMAVVIIPPFINLPLLSLVALPIFLSALLGIKFRKHPKKSKIHKPTGIFVYPESNLPTELRIR